MSDNSTYQKLRGHLAYLRLAAAAEALPAELDHAAKHKLGHTAFLERLLDVEVAATEAIQTAIDRAVRASNASPHCRHRGGSTTSTSTPNPPSTAPSSTSSAPFGSSRTPPTCC